METRAPKVKNDLIVRLRRIEGQVRGVLRMVEEDRDCEEILQQIRAIYAALRQTSLVAARAYAARCLEDAGAGDYETTLNALIAALSKLE